MLVFKPTELTILYYVARFHSFTRACRRLRVTQSTISIHVKTLEDEFGVSLVERNTKKITPAGSPRKALLSCSWLRPL